MSENKHLTLDERNFIEQELAKNTSFREIAQYLSKDPTTISKEVRKHRIKKEGRSVHVNFNHCAKKYNCHRHNLVKLIVQKNVDIVIIAIRFALILSMVLALN